MPPAVTTGEQFKLSNAPNDTISAVHFQPGGAAQYLVASSWDCKVRLYDVISGGQRTFFEHASPVLTSCFTDAIHTISGSLEGAVKYFDFNSSQGELFALLILIFYSRFLACINNSLLLSDKYIQISYAAAMNQIKHDIQLFIFGHVSPHF